MFRIGEFSRIARVSLRLLRYYDEIGLFVPHYVDEESGYRYYSASQLPQLNRILVLKDLGLSLDQISRAVAREILPEELRALLEERRKEAQRAMEIERMRLRQLESRIAQIENGGHLHHDDVILRSEPLRYFFSTRETVASFQEASDIIRDLKRSLGAGPAPIAGFGAIAHSPEFEPGSIDVELGFFLKEDDSAGLPDKTRAGRDLSLRTLPAVDRVAVCVRVGPPDQAHAGAAQIGGFVEAHGLALDGPNREIFLRGPDLQKMQESVVEMVFPVRARE